MKWIEIDKKLPPVWEDVLISAINTKAYSSFKVGEQYHAVDRIAIWKDGVPPSFSTQRFKNGIVTHWAKLPKLPKWTNKDENLQTTNNGVASASSS